MNKEALMVFYKAAWHASELPNLSKKIKFLLDKTKIDNRHS